jgi:hypothetical protein
MCLIEGTRSIHEYHATSHDWATDRSVSRDHVLFFYVQVTVHRDKLRIKQPTKCIKYPKFILS